MEGEASDGTTEATGGEDLPVPVSTDKGLEGEDLPVPALPEKGPGGETSGDNSESPSPKADESGNSSSTEGVATEDVAPFLIVEEPTPPPVSECVYDARPDVASNVRKRWIRTMF